MKNAIYLEREKYIELIEIGHELVDDSSQVATFLHSPLCGDAVYADSIIRNDIAVGTYDVVLLRELVALAVHQDPT